MDGDKRIALLEEDIARFQQNLVSLEKDRKRLPRLAALAVLALPAGWRFGLAGVLGVLGLLAVVGIALWYLVDGHRAEYENRIRMTRQEIMERQRQASTSPLS